MKKITLAIMATLLTTAMSAQTASIVSGNTSFSIGSIVGTLQGTFEAPKGKFVFDPANLSATRIDIAIPANSVFTDHKRRDSDAKGEKYLDVERFSTIRFVSTKVEAKDTGFLATGNLTIKDITKTVTLPFDAKKNQDGTYSLSSTFEVNRLDYGVGGKTFMLRNVATVHMDALAR
ncbi:YceI family protein [Parapedobacter tibetensis]|uniref:YceI family protein n=1 Tax=Parapedobacter tibetensis TaxID=2972951 RepID=UPI00214D743E|nr:YceI family protein [Parapedobacter tibetensis]